MSYKVYPHTAIDINHNAYKVKINGEDVPLNTARVSAVPFNRRWPGHQRSIDQTELINFVSLETDEALNFEITPAEPFEKVEILPESLGIVPDVSTDGKISFTLSKSAYFTVEPYGRRNALHIFADPLSSYNVSVNDENVIYFGKGEHDVGTIELTSNQTLFIDEGAVVYACVKAMDADNISIIGRGILDNSRNKEIIHTEMNVENNTSAVKNAKRIHTVQLEYCNNIKIEGITIRDSLVYNIRPLACSGIDISNVKIIGCWRYNSDGIDMHNCVDVRISNCFLRTFDDSICIKGFDCYYSGDVEEAVQKAMYRNGKAYDVFKNVVVSDCVIWNDWGKCLEIGAETRAEEICNIVFENCDIIHVNSSVLDCDNVDYADVHDVVFRGINIRYDDTTEPPKIQKSDADCYVNDEPDYAPMVIHISVIYHPEYSAGGNKRGKNRNIAFDDIRLYGRHKPVIFAAGYDEEHLTSDITIKNFYVNDKPLKEGEYELITNEFSKNISVIIKQ